MAIIMTSHTIVDQIYQDLRSRLGTLSEQGIVPHLAVILVGDDQNSITYVGIKEKQAKELGIDFKVHRLSENVEEEAVLKVIDELNTNPEVTGMIIQLPLPLQLDTDRLLAHVKIEKDVDGLRSSSPYMPPTVSAIFQLFESYDIKLTDKQIVLIGKGRLVGGPLMRELKALGLNFTVCDESTGDLAACTLEADILISATGEKHLIKPFMIKEGAVVIDVDKEVIYDEVQEKVGYITPQQGGVGPLTVAYLLSNVIEAAELQRGVSSEEN